MRNEPPAGPLAIFPKAWRFFWRRKARALRIFILGLVPEFHGTREGAAIVELMLDTGKTAGERYAATHVQLGWTLSSNHRVNRGLPHGPMTSRGAVTGRDLIAE